MYVQHCPAHYTTPLLANLLNSFAHCYFDHFSMHKSIIPIVISDTPGCRYIIACKSLDNAILFFKTWMTWQGVVRLVTDSEYFFLKLFSILCTQYWIITENPLIWQSDGYCIISSDVNVAVSLVVLLLLLILLLCYITVVNSLTDYYEFPGFYWSYNLVTWW